MNKEILIAIPTKNRPEVIKKFLIKHYKEEYEYCISIENQDIESYNEIINEYKKINFLYLENDKGVGYARNRISSFGIENGFKNILFSDDNARWDINKVEDCLKIMNKHDIEFLSAFFRIYDFFFNIKENKNKVIPVKFAHIVFIISTKLLRMENFDENLILFEDNDLNLRLKKRIFPKHLCYIYRDWKAVKKRHNLGGCSKFKDAEKLQWCCNYINEKHNFKVASYNEKTNSCKFAWVAYCKFFNIVETEKKEINNEDLFE